MNVVTTALPGVLILEPKVFGDDRGFFYESYNRKVLAEKAGITADFVQDNHSRSARNVLRGLHYQIRQPQGKLVRVVAGEVFDVVVDIRKSSPTFGKPLGINLSAENKRMLWIPPGFAHGFLVLSDYAEFLYKTTDYWAPEHERCIIWNDPVLNIDWPLAGAPVLSAKDQAGLPLSEAEVFA
ncbi:MAG: dTDP-4-dehydrorhamnose 3,5-epimerase [Pseudomonadota bacterium]